ncbi:MAG: methyltransferase domain-containing protein [Candidatus Eisenbacteria bacterium]|nr:methyltransferase domain-containing protein [Candidatus Eisenbacteria bacterium]
MQSPRRIEIAALTALLSLAGLRIIDLRSPRSFRHGHLPGSGNLPHRRLPSSLFLLPPRRTPILLVAATGATALAGAQFLADRGYEESFWLDGAVSRLSAAKVPGPASAPLWEPSPFLREALAALPDCGAAVDLACGSGRNTVFLARHGWSALGIDLLPDAIAQARRLAREAGMDATRVRFRVGDLTDPQVIGRILPPGRYDAILCFRYLDRRIWPALRAAIRPGGFVVMQTFLLEQARVHGKPRRPEFLLRPGELSEVFSDWEILRSHEGPDADQNHLAGIVARRRS